MKSWYHVTKSKRHYRCHVCGHLFPHSDYRFQTKIRHLNHPDFGSECDDNVLKDGDSSSFHKHRKGYWDKNGNYQSF